MPQILFVEDDELIASGLIYALKQEGYTVCHCRDVAGAVKQMAGDTYALGLLDLSLPDGSGHEICRMLRERGVPVIFLSAVDDEGNVVRGLEMGADDYVTKPFRLRELLARIAGTLRRHSAGDADAPIRIGSDLCIDVGRARVLRGGEEIALTALEYRLLLTFAAHKGQVLSRAQLLEGIWDAAGCFVNDNTLTVYVRRLREKLGDTGPEPQLIQTVRGMGYRLNG